MQSQRFNPQYGDRDSYPIGERESDLDLDLARAAGGSGNYAVPSERHYPGHYGHSGGGGVRRGPRGRYMHAGADFAESRLAGGMDVGGEYEEDHFDDADGGHGRMVAYAGAEYGASGADVDVEGLGDSAVGPSSHLDSLDVEDAGGEIPVAWRVIELPFRKEIRLGDLHAAKNPDVEINFEATHGRNLALKELMESGAYLGDVSVVGLRFSNAPVSFAVRAESKGLALPEPNVFAAAVRQPVHAVISKRSPLSAGTDIHLRRCNAVMPTLLSTDYPGWTVNDLDRDIKTTLNPEIQEIATDHPIVGHLLAEGHLDDKDVADTDTIRVDRFQAAGARAAIERAEANNPKMSDAKSLTLRLVRAYGAAESAGAPAWNDPEELIDDYTDLKSAATAKAVDQRLSKPIVIEGAWRIAYGKVQNLLHLNGAGGGADGLGAADVGL